MKISQNTKPGTRVKMWDEEDGKLAYGTLTKAKDDKVYIQWDDIDSECDHGEDEWPLIEVQ